MGPVLISPCVISGDCATSCGKKKKNKCCKKYKKSGKTNCKRCPKI